MAIITSFQEYAAGSTPADWTQNSGSYVLTVSADAAAISGKSMAQTSVTTAGFKTWDKVPSTADVDILIIQRLPASLTANDGFLRNSGRVDATGQNGYFFQWIATTNQIQMFKTVAGVNTGIGTNIARTYAANDVVAARMQLLGSTIRCKAWLYSGAEPGAWDVSTTDTSVTAAGAAGVRLATITANAADYWFAVGLNGLSAPMPFEVFASNERLRPRQHLRR
jgi:hypothetical protein